jgi:hypothetical protein
MVTYKNFHHIEMTLQKISGCKSLALILDCLVCIFLLKMFLSVPYKFQTFIFEPAFGKIPGKLWKQ